MKLNTVIFDMDGVLIDSEPLWNQVANDVFNIYGIQLTEEQYKTSTGLRTKEFVEWWFRVFNIREAECAFAIEKINKTVIDKIGSALPLPGINQVFELCKELNFKIGIASSSPVELIERVMDICNIRQFVQAITSAQDLPYGKPHPQVYLDCATALHSDPLTCICLEDSFNGMIAVKAARMKCVVVPHVNESEDAKWGAADLKISSLENFNSRLLDLL